MTELIDLSRELTPAFFKAKDIKKGSVLVFTTEDGEETHLKIVRLNRTKRICKAEPVKLYTEQEVTEMAYEDAEELKENG